MPTPFETADDLAARVAFAEAAATQAEADRTSVCHAEQAGRQATAAMDTAATAHDYMQLSTIALNAFRILEHLDDALQFAHDANAQAMTAQADAVATTGEAAVIAAGHAATMLRQQPLDFNGLHTNAAHQNDATLARGDALTVSNNARQLGIDAGARVADAGATKAAATNAREASLEVESATSKAHRLAQAGAGLPPAPDPALAPQYDIAIVALQAAAANAALPASIATAAAAGTRMGASVPDPAGLRAQRLVIRNAAQKTVTLQARGIYTRLAVRTAQAGHFATDVTELGDLATEANDSAQDMAGAVRAAVAPMAQIRVEALALPADLLALRAHANAVYMAAHAAASLLPYDPSINCGHAQTALTQLEQAQAVIPDLLAREAATRRELQRARQVLAQAESAAAALRVHTRRARETELHAAWDRARIATRSHAAKSVFQKAKENLTTADAAVADCPLLQGTRRTNAQAALQSVVDARARLENAGHTPQIDAAEASIARARIAVDAIAAADARTRAALAAARVCLGGARTAWDDAVSARIAQQRAEGHGPQRHEGGPTPEDLGRRALYCIDPERGDQLDAETGGLHAADANASKFTTEEIYVKAELLARAAPPGTTASLSRLGPGAAVGVTCPLRPTVRRPVTLNLVTPALALRVPVSAAYIDDGTQPPPTPAQMDDAAITAELAALTQATVFAPDAEIKAILRTDTQNKIFLRTMWPQNPQP